MTTRPAVINTTTSVRDAAKVMTSGHFRHLPVVGDAGLVGFVDITGVCRALLEPHVPGRPSARPSRLVLAAPSPGPLAAPGASGRKKDVGNPGRTREPSAPVRHPVGFIALFIFIVNNATRRPPKCPT
jgi:CBS domain-containing protein